MRIIGRLMAAMAVAALGAACAPAEETPEQAQARMQEETAAFRQAIEAMQADYERWEAGGMADSVASLYAENAVVAFPHQPILRGRQAVRDNAAEFYALGSVTLDIRTESAMASGALGVERGTYVQNMTGPNVPPPMAAMFPDSGSYMTHWHFVDGVWKVAELIVTSQRPMPGMGM